MKLRNKCAWSVCVLAGMITGSACAQWSSDPAVNLAIADRPGEQVQPKIVATTDGGAYLSWFDNSEGGYDVYLQRLDAGGNEQWAHDGILIADRTFSSTEDYDLGVDAADNALLTFRDTRLTGTQITATKVTPAGAQPWGATGVQLTNTTAYVTAPKITATSDGFIVVAWMQDGDIGVMKLNSAGTPQWGATTWITDPGGMNFIPSDLVAGDAGSVVLGIVQSGGFPDPRHLYAHKIGPAGTALWPSPVAVFDGGSLQFGNFPGIVSDSAGGAVFAWYETSPLQCRVQRVNAAGAEVFAHNGVVASTNAAAARVSPSADFNPATQEIFLFFREMNSGQSQWGVYGQKFDAAGVRQWTDTGAVIVPVGSLELTQIRCLVAGNGAEAYWVEALSFGNQRVFGAQVDKDGLFTWTPNIVMPSSLVTGKSRLVVARSAQGFAMLEWEDERDDAADIYVQNVNADGSFGPSWTPCPEDLLPPPWRGTARPHRGLESLGRSQLPAGRRDVSVCRRPHGSPRRGTAGSHGGAQSMGRSVMRPSGRPPRFGTSARHARPPRWASTTLTEVERREPTPCTAWVSFFNRTSFQHRSPIRDSSDHPTGSALP